MREIEETLQRFANLRQLKLLSGIVAAYKKR